MGDTGEEFWKWRNKVGNSDAISLEDNRKTNRQKIEGDVKDSEMTELKGIRFKSGDL